MVAFKTEQAAASDIGYVSSVANSNPITKVLPMKNL